MEQDASIPVTLPMTSELLQDQGNLKGDPSKNDQPHHNAKAKTCPEFTPTYDPRQLVEITVHLDILKNFV
jgi:hypothetical protein